MVDRHDEAAAHAQCHAGCGEADLALVRALCGEVDAEGLEKTLPAGLPNNAASKASSGSSADPAQSKKASPKARPLMFCLVVGLIFLRLTEAVRQLPASPLAPSRR